jgi:hypothetical protein
VRALALTVAGWLIGVGLTAALLWLTHLVLVRITAPREFEVEHWVIYLGLVLGSGFGALCGALIHLGRNRSLSSPPPTERGQGG